MNTHRVTFCGTDLEALPSGAAWIPADRTLVVSDLHLGKAERMARRGGPLLPPFEVEETLNRLEADIERTSPAQVICLGDSFDDTAAAEALPEDAVRRITRLQAGRKWIWIAGNHDPGPMSLGGDHRAELSQGALNFRHIARPDLGDERGEISGHYHPKASLLVRGRMVTRRCMLMDARRMILPAYGTYTGGLRSHDSALRSLMADDALAILTGPQPCAIPMPR